MCPQYGPHQQLGLLMLAKELNQKRGHIDILNNGHV